MRQTLSRRTFLTAGTCAGVSPWFPARARAAAEPVRLMAGAGRAPLVGAGHPETEVLCFNGTVPGPEIRVRQGSRLRVAVENRLAQETTVHWHGVCLPNAMDGVPHLTQEPISRGETFLYEFDVPDAGTFWYHPHQRSFEQIGRGLSGAPIVEEKQPLQVDRDVTWMLSDWRLLRSAQLTDDFGNLHDTPPRVAGHRVDSPAGARRDGAFVADNPGDWMFHCHVLEHQAGGMMGLVRVA